MLFGYFVMFAHSRFYFVYSQSGHYIYRDREYSLWCMVTTADNAEVLNYIVVLYFGKQFEIEVKVAFYLCLASLVCELPESG